MPVVLSLQSYAQSRAYTPRQLAILENLLSDLLVEVNENCAPAEAQYLTLATNSVLTSERTLGLTAGHLTGSDGGAGAAYTVGLATTAVTAGSYGGAGKAPSLTVDAYGRLTAAADVTLVQDAISDSVTDIAPSQNAVFDALALKQPRDATLTALSGQNWIANALPIGSGADTVAQISFAANTFPARASTGNLVAKSITDASLSALATGLGSVATLDVDTDGTLAANSDTRVASQKATKTYVDALIAANDAMVFKGVIDCSANPNYPAADRGHTYRVSVAGKIGGGSGPNVEAGDILLCITDGTASGTHAGVGANWGIIQLNIDGALTTANIGSTVQGYDGTLAAFAALTIAANSLTIGTGADAFSQTTFAANTFPARASTGDLVAKTITDFALTLLDDTNLAGLWSTIGGTVNIDGGTIDGTAIGASAQATGAFTTGTFTASTGSAILGVRNTSSGASSYTRFSIGDDLTAGRCELYAFSSLFTETAIEKRNGGMFYTSGSGGFSFVSQSGDLRFAAGSISALTALMTFTNTTFNTGLIVNEGGSEYDTRIEGDTLDHMIFCDATASTENIALLSSGAPNWQSMDRGIFIGNMSAAPSGNPTSGIYVYVDAGAGKARGTSGTITTWAPADPHCPVCGTDYVHEWENARYGKHGYLAVCMNCHVNGVNSHTRTKGAWKAH